MKEQLAAVVAAGTAPTGQAAAESAPGLPVAAQPDAGAQADEAQQDKPLPVLLTAGALGIAAVIGVDSRAHERALEFVIAELCEADEVQQDKPIPELVTTGARGIAAVVGGDSRTHEFSIAEVCGQLPRPPEKAADAVEVADAVRRASPAQQAKPIPELVTRLWLAFLPRRRPML